MGLAAGCYYPALPVVCRPVSVAVPMAGVTPDAGGLAPSSANKQLREEQQMSVQMLLHVCSPLHKMMDEIKSMLRDGYIEIKYSKIGNQSHK